MKRQTLWTNPSEICNRNQSGVNPMESLYTDTEIISFEQLKLATGYQRPAEIAAHLTLNKVPFFLGKYGRPYMLRTFYLQSYQPVKNPTTTHRPFIEA